MSTKEQEYLLSQQAKRKYAIEIYGDFLKEIVEKLPSGKSKKKMCNRCLLVFLVKNGANTLFENEQKEYEFVGKFGRGMWADCRTTFNKEELKTIVDFAEAYGAFDY